MSLFRRPLLILCIGACCITAQGSILRGILPTSWTPNLQLILMVYCALSDVSIGGVLLCFLLGLEYDLFSGTILGPWAGAFSLVAGVLALAAQRIFLESALTVLLLVACSSIVATTVYLTLLYQFRPVASDVVSWSMLETLVTALVAPLMFRLLRPLYTSRPKSSRTVKRVVAKLASISR